ncbi:branched-chain amino acid ABC transporter permease [Sphingobium sp. R-21]|uniref:branched-chain amino acid ABC transporter permease n=1 Tax=Sphingobium sp. R-21 TaxID=3404056 RepID=UPI003CEFBD4D
MSFFLNVLVGGALAGVMYALVAIGFVLIYRASGVFNFAQGTMILFAALTFANLVEMGAPMLLAFLVTFALLIGSAFLTERLVLRPLANRSVITLFLATLGLSYIFEGVAQIAWGTQVHSLDIGLPDEPVDLFGLSISSFDLAATAIAALLVVGLALLTGRTGLGLALRAVAADPLAALSIGIRQERVTVIAWSLAGFVALVAGLLWGARSGVQFSLALIVLKALPVLIIGGFTSVGGVIVAGIVVGAGEKLAEIFLGPVIGSGIENWFAYVLALLFLMIRPTGLFGQRDLARI